MSMFIFSGNGDILIRATSKCNIAGKVYDTNEVITMLKDVKIDVSYNRTVKSLTSERGALINDQRIFLDTIMVYDINKVDSIMEMLFSRNTTPCNHIPIMYREAATGTDLALRVESGETISDLFIYRNVDGIKEKMTLNNVNPSDGEYSFNSNNNVVSNLTIGGDYTMSYYINKESILSQKLIEALLPILKLEIISYGDLQSNTQSTVQSVITIPTCSLITDPDSTMRYGALDSMTLAFKAVKTKEISIDYYNK